MTAFLNKCLVSRAGHTRVLQKNEKCRRGPSAVSENLWHEELKRWSPNTVYFFVASGADYGRR
jgi:hypothetical protein